MSMLSVLFVLARARMNKRGRCAIYCRITYLKKRKEFTTGIFIDPNDWRAKKQNSVNNIINKKLSLIKNEINQAFLFLEVNNKSFDVDDVYLKYRGEELKCNKSVLQVFSEHNHKMQALVGKTYSKGTLRKFIQTKNHIQSFIKRIYNKNDIEFSELNMKFLDDLDFYLKSVCNHKQISINKTIQRFRKIVILAISEDIITKDPFMMFKPKKVQIKIVYLNKEELSEIEKYTFKQSRLQQVKDMFVFCCYSGLAYNEMSLLNTKHLNKDEDGVLWISICRQKTDKDLVVPVLKKAEYLINQYKNEYDVFPKISNQKFNSYLKEIANVIGIEKNLTHHIARKTFATTVLLGNDIPMEIVSELLGHSKIDITQKHYAKTVKSKLKTSVVNLNL